jgi:hypothetical protein
VHHQALLVLVGGDLPQLLDADAVGLRVDAVTQLEAGFELLAQVAAAAFGEQGVLGPSLPSLRRPMSPVITPATAPLSSNSSWAPEKPG